MVEDPLPTGSLTAAATTQLVTVLQQQMGPMQAQLATMEKRLNCNIGDVINISSDEEDESNVPEEEERSSDSGFESPKRVQPTQSSHGTRSKTPASSKSKAKC